MLYSCGSQSTKCSVTSHTPFGLTANWQNARSIQSPAPAPAGVQEASPESKSNTTLSTRLIYGSTIGNGPSRAATTKPDDATPTYRYGGFVSENLGSGQIKHGGQKTRKASETLKYKVCPATTPGQCLTTISLVYHEDPGTPCPTDTTMHCQQ
jgi:hypothetical protein